MFSIIDYMGNREKMKKISKKLLTNRNLCDIINFTINSPYKTHEAEIKMPAALTESGRR